MKKAISILMAVILLFSLSSISVSAKNNGISADLQKLISESDPDQPLDICVLFKGYLRQFDEMPSFPDEAKAAEEYREYLLETERNHCEIAFEDVDVIRRYGGSGNVTFVSVKAKDIPKIAASDNVILASPYEPYWIDFLCGDADRDGTLSVLDATAIQKRLASLLAFSPYQEYLGDTDGDGALSVLDATYIQKRLASVIQRLPAEEIDGRGFHNIQFEGLSAFRYIKDYYGFVPVNETDFYTDIESVFRIEAFSDDELEYEVIADGKVVKKRDADPFFRYGYLTHVFDALPSLTINVYSSSGEKETRTFELTTFGLGDFPE